MNLKDYAKSLTAQLKLMEGREKGDIEALFGPTTTINDFGFLSGDDGEYVVFTVQEDPKNFYFGGGVLTDHMKKIEADGFGDMVRNEGLPFTLEKKKSKQGRQYANPVFYPEV